LPPLELVTGASIGVWEKEERKKSARRR